MVCRRDVASSRLLYVWSRWMFAGAANRCRGMRAFSAAVATAHPMSLTRCWCVRACVRRCASERARALAANGPTRPAPARVYVRPCLDSQYLRTFIWFQRRNEFVRWICGSDLRLRLALVDGPRPRHKQTLLVAFAFQIRERERQRATATTLVRPRGRKIAPTPYFA